MWRSLLQVASKKTSGKKIIVQRQESFPKHLPTQISIKMQCNKVKKSYNVHDNATHKIYNFKKVPNYNDVPLL